MLTHLHMVMLAHLLRRSCWLWNGSTRRRKGGKTGHCEWLDVGLGRTCASSHLCWLMLWWRVAWRWHVAMGEGPDVGLHSVMGHLMCQVTFGRLWTVSRTDLTLGRHGLLRVWSLARWLVGSRHLMLGGCIRSRLWCVRSSFGHANGWSSHWDRAVSVQSNQHVDGQEWSDGTVLCPVMWTCASDHPKECPVKG
jgi:hypothetical protein